MTDKPSSPSFEETLTELEAIVNDMENGDLPLNQALEKFERGIKLSRLSQQSLEQAQQKVQILLRENGEDTLADFSEPDSSDTP